MGRAFLFDFDGTLVDTMNGFADIAGHIIHKHHPEMSFDEARNRYIETSGVPFCQQIELIFPDHELNEDTVNYFEETKIQGFFEQKFENDVREAINGLRSKGYLVGVSSGNFPDLINEFVKRENLVFDIVLGFDKKSGFEKGKPHFDYVLENRNLKKEDLTFVGDSLKDAEKAIEYGVDFIGVCGIFTKEDFEGRFPGVKTINNLKELLSL